MRAATRSPKRPLRPLVGVQEAFWDSGHVRSRVAAIGRAYAGGRVGSAERSDAGIAWAPRLRPAPMRRRAITEIGLPRVPLVLTQPARHTPAWSRYGVGGCGRNALPIAKWPRAFASASPHRATLGGSRWLLIVVDAGRGGAAASPSIADAGMGWARSRYGMGAPARSRPPDAGMGWAGMPVHDGHPCRYAMGARRIVALVRRRAGGTVWRGRMPVADGRPVRPGGGSGRRWAGGARSSHSGCGGGSRQAFRK